MAELIYSGIFLGAALAGFGAALGIWAAYRYSTTRSDGHFVALLFWLIGLSAVLVEALATRSPPSIGIGIISNSESSGLESTPTAISSMLGKLSVPFIVGLAFVRFILDTVKWQPSSFREFGGGKADPARPLYYSYLFYFVCCGLLNSVAGTQPAFVHWMFYPVFIIGAAYFSRTYETNFLIKNVKWILLALIYFSLLAAILFPKFAFETGYKGLIPGLNIRLYGLAGHPNTLGPVALIFLLLEYYSPSSGWVRYIHRISALSVVLLAQSKTAYGAALLVFVILLWYRFSTDKSAEKHFDARLKFLTTLILSVSFIGLTMLSLNLVEINVPANPFSYLDAQELKYLGTLTGRTIIWDITLKEWEQNLLFGYGPTIWYPEFRAKFGLMVVGQAHNQFIQTLGEAGIVGFLGLLVYIFSLLKAAFLTAKATRGVTLALTAIPLLRMWTESPFRNFVINDWAFFTHLLVICLLMGFLREMSKSVGILKESNLNNEWNIG